MNKCVGIMKVEGIIPKYDPRTGRVIKYVLVRTRRGLQEIPLRVYVRKYGPPAPPTKPEKVLEVELNLLRAIPADGELARKYDRVIVSEIKKAIDRSGAHAKLTRKHTIDTYPYILRKGGVEERSKIIKQRYIVEVRGAEVPKAFFDEVGRLVHSKTLQKAGARITRIKVRRG